MANWRKILFGVSRTIYGTELFDSVHIHGGLWRRIWSNWPGSDAAAAVTRTGTVVGGLRGRPFADDATPWGRA